MKTSSKFLDGMKGLHKNNTTTIYIIIHLMSYLSMSYIFIIIVLSNIIYNIILDWNGFRARIRDYQL